LTTGTAAALVIVSAALHAAWNVALRREPDTTASATVIIAGSGLLSAALALLLPPPVGGLDGGSLRWGLCAGVFEGIYFIALARAMSIGPIGTVYAIARGLPTVLIWPVAYWLLGEPLGVHPALAVALLVIGLIALVPGVGAPRHEFAGYGWAVITALGIVGAQIVYKLALEHGARPMGLFAGAMVSALAMGLGSMSASLPRVSMALIIAPVRLGAACLACTVSFALALIALHDQGAAWIFSLRNSSIAFAQLMGWVLLRERPSPRALAGVALIFAAVVWLGFG
jgi:drug/metabolite transporter (DMT)-like permease